jgi:hypothetical protein
VTGSVFRDGRLPAPPPEDEPIGWDCDSEPEEERRKLNRYNILGQARDAVA